MIPVAFMATCTDFSYQCGKRSLMVHVWQLILMMSCQSTNCISNWSFRISFGERQIGGIVVNWDKVRHVGYVFAAFELLIWQIHFHDFTNFPFQTCDMGRHEFRSWFLEPVQLWGPRNDSRMGCPGSQPREMDVAESLDVEEESRTEAAYDEKDGKLWKRGGRGGILQLWAHFFLEVSFCIGESNWYYYHS